MGNNTDSKKEDKPKGFFGRLVEKLDKKMRDKAKDSKSCCGNDSGQKSSCCS